MKKIIFTLFCLLSLDVLACVKVGENITISRLWARPTHGNNMSTAVYMNIINKGELDYLTNVRTNIARMTTIHKTIFEQGVAQMVQVNRLAIPANTTIILQPKALHIMLMGLNTSLAVGESFDLELTFEKAGTVTVQVPVKGNEG
jgi:copper(I)-binding protein